MNIVRYQRYPQRDLSVSFSRFHNIQAELDRVFGTSFGSLVRPLVLPSRWNPAVDVYQDKGVRTERFFGKFQRNLTLPVAVTSEKVTATYHDGILKVILPKAEESKPKQISVSLN
jgi:hypothetical protein